MIVTIPAKEHHEGIYSIEVDISDVCPVYGGPRGVPYGGLSYDGSRRLHVDQWDNPCGHVDKYDAVRAEAAKLLKDKQTGNYRQSTIEEDNDLWNVSGSDFWR